MALFRGLFPLFFLIGFSSVAEAHVGYDIHLVKYMKTHVETAQFMLEMNHSSIGLLKKCVCRKYSMEADPRCELSEEEEVIYRTSEVNSKGEKLMKVVACEEIIKKQITIPIERRFKKMRQHLALSQRGQEGDINFRTEQVGLPAFRQMEVHVDHDLMNIPFISDSVGGKMAPLDPDEQQEAQETFNRFSFEICTEYVRKNKLFPNAHMAPIDICKKIILPTQPLNHPNISWARRSWWRNSYYRYAIKRRNREFRPEQLDKYNKLISRMPILFRAEKHDYSGSELLDWVENFYLGSEKVNDEFSAKADIYLTNVKEHLKSRDDYDLHQQMALDNKFIDSGIQLAGGINIAYIYTNLFYQIENPEVDTEPFFPYIHSRLERQKLNSAIGKIAGILAVVAGCHIFKAGKLYRPLCLFTAGMGANVVFLTQVFQERQEELTKMFSAIEQRYSIGDISKLRKADRKLIYTAAAAVVLGGVEIVFLKNALKALP